MRCGRPKQMQKYDTSVVRYSFVARKTVVDRVRTIVQKTDSPIVDSIGQNYRPMR